MRQHGWRRAVASSRAGVRRAPLDILAANAAPIECVPAVMHLDLLPDMGRMTGRLPLAAKITCSLAPMPVVAAPRQSIP